MTEFELFQALRPHYPAREYALLPRTGSGTGAGVIRHCDALALSLWPSRGLYLSGFEIKSHRGDWLLELRTPEKSEEISRYCNFWWIVAARPFVKADELPQAWGLMVWDEKIGALTKTKRAPFREALKPDLPFVAAMFRRAQEVVGPGAALAEARAEGMKAGKAEAELQCEFALEEFGKLRRQLGQFEKSAGVKIDDWHGPSRIGEAVKEVLNNTVNRGRDQLLAVAQGIIRDLDAGPGGEA